MVTQWRHEDHKFIHLSYKILVDKTDSPVYNLTIPWADPES